MGRYDRSSQGRYKSSKRENRSPSRHSRDASPRRDKRRDGSSDRDEISNGRRVRSSHRDNSRRNAKQFDGYSDDDRRQRSRDTRRGGSRNDEEDIKHYINLIHKQFKAMLSMINDETEMINKHPSMSRASRTKRSVYGRKIEIPGRPDDSRDATALDMIKELEHGIREVQDKINLSDRTRFFKQVLSGMERNLNSSSRQSRRRYRDGDSRDRDCDEDYVPRRTERRKYRDDRDQEKCHRGGRHGEDRYHEERIQRDRHRRNGRREDKYRDDGHSGRSRRDGRRY